MIGTPSVDKTVLKCNVIVHCDYILFRDDAGFGKETLKIDDLHGISFLHIVCMYVCLEFVQLENFSLI